MNNEPNNSASNDACYVIGVDVGTGSARAGLFDLTGKLISTAKREISLYREAGAIVEQSANEIWQAVCHSVREVVSAAQIDAKSVVGLGFDATCSLVVVGDEGRPLAVGPSEDPERNIIVWMDHRAVDQAERINELNHDVLRYVGGRISPEMETPKLLWLKENRKEIYDTAWQFFDLVDYLTWRATGSLARSMCTVTCKWTYLAHEQSWDASYFNEIGLGDLAASDFYRIGSEVVEPGTALAQGLTITAAEALGLSAGTAVAAGMIDAHAGGIGTVGYDGQPQSNLGYVFGTSSCTMTSTIEPVFVAGVWGPYYSAMVPGMWLNEGGQSVAGAAIDQLISFHPASGEAAKIAESKGVALPVLLADLAAEKFKDSFEAIKHAAGIHIVPEFLGNRAPFSDPNARAVITGLSMERDLKNLVAIYIAGVASVGYGLRQIIETQAAAGAKIEQIVISGGAGQHEFVRQILADATGKPIVAPQSDEPVLLGAAILGAIASDAFSNMRDAMHALSDVERIYHPANADVSKIHDRRFEIFKELQIAARHIRDV